ncbi:gliding motility lipoprotein GldH [Flavobacterium agricola]|uniref:Gliding motility lipoprotein GldH n=2 Tax=Flavobacterium agricola TaxID=2870839 RepID=A0ABY6M2F6_9FLAO|nr:gliding motility lipoprotein GldH [Flavobacterium agricola]UYW02641.1 gliding motility lipoprotein GldH [Flavobacterium agricola]
MLKNKTFSFIFAVLFVFCFASCDKHFVYDQYQQTNGTWEANNPFVFEYEALDTLTPYNYFINLRVNKDFPYNNLFLIVETELPSQKTLIDTVQYLMAAPDGELLGNGFSDVKESKLWFKEQVPFTEKGLHKIKISQAVRELGKVNGVQELKGITEVGFRIEKIDNND